MRALVIAAAGEVVATERPLPEPGPDEIRVRVRASALNRADLLQTLGLYPAPPGVPADVPGLEYAGVVDAVGARVTRWREGDRVLGLVAGGAWAEALLTHGGEAMAVPAGVDLEAAAAIPEAFATAWDALVVQAGLCAGQWVLVHAVGSGVGTAALQLAALQGARVVGTSRTASKLEAAQALADFVPVDTAQTRDFAPAVLAATEGRGADVVLDLVGGETLPSTLACTAERGTVMVVGLTAGAAAQVPLQRLLGRRLTLRGTTLRARPLDEKLALARRFEREVLPFFAQGRLRPVVAKTLSAAQANQALAAMRRNDTFGKTLLTFD